MNHKHLFIGKHCASLGLKKLVNTIYKIITLTVDVEKMIILEQNFLIKIDDVMFAP